ncbi:hypothetical protein [Corynebacterium sp. ACRQP]|uniref:hypothetical protein n=1 Tax=Corynebacterium sp. ACRQP TaxID=2918195 RepID=UPI001EF68EAA|nr:hypothetical protein [Corynebacterium sp. ACRQP]MCG7237148.1 hypothetical protein [Corynebacterium sp. ACRQP]
MNILSGLFNVSTTIGLLIVHQAARVIRRFVSIVQRSNCKRARMVQQSVSDAFYAR